MSTIITVATMKGGSGKSTLASCLAVHWQLGGRRPTLIDADPQRSVARLAARERALGGVPVIEDATETASGEMTNRVIYAEAALWGATPSLIESNGPAARDIAAIAAEVDNILAIKQAA